MADREEYYLGFDAGGTKTDCVLLNAKGDVLAENSAGPANPLRAGFDRAQSSLRTAAEKALSARQVGAASVVGVCAGIAGAGQPRVLKRVMGFLVETFPRAYVQVCTDLEIALEAGLGDGPGIVIVAGTGSAALGRSPDGRQVRAGGDGPWVGDEGSAFDIGRRGIAAVARARDALGPATTLADSIPAALQCPDWSALLERIAAGPDEVFPRIFPLVAQAAESGDTPAREILFGAALSLSQLVMSVARRLEIAQQEFTVAEAGGVFGVSPLLDQSFEALLHSSARGAHVRPVQIPPARAAARRALRGRQAEAGGSRGARTKD
ncbi:MAG TPA: BadF/BadG/BcrA/BcrD ATPase family protein [Candidatus Acidoferrales bacterium]|nr:BadF/BadG/BcrA/BcrD ATPase family protein [Candidatus Acidoferrales bacterium]